MLRCERVVKLRIHAEAEAELTAAVLWYDEQRPGLGEDLLTEVEAGFEVIAHAPRAWPRWPDAPPRDPPIRRLLMRRFPFAIGYQVFDGDDVLVLAVAHTHRAPMYWVRRSVPEL